MVEIDATGKVLIVGRHSQLIHWTGNLDAGDCCRLAIGKTNEPLWMLFTLQLVRAVTPPQTTWLQTAERKRVLGLRTRAFLLDGNSPGKRQLFSGWSPTQNARAFLLDNDSPGKRQLFSGWSPTQNASQEQSVRTERINLQNSSSQEAVVVRRDLKEAPRSRDEQSLLHERDDEIHSLVGSQSLAPEDHMSSGAVPKSGLAAENPAKEFVSIVAARNVTPHTTCARDVEERALAISPQHFEPCSEQEYSPTLLQSTEELDSQPVQIVRRRLCFETDGAGGRKVAAETQIERSPSPCLSLPMGQSLEDSPLSIHEATEPQWRILGDSQTSPQVRLCLNMKLSDWEQVHSNTVVGALSRAVADLVVAKNKDRIGPTWLPSLLDGCELAST
jgi:hypothetical protein